MNIEELKKQVAEYAKIAFRSESHPHGMTWTHDGQVTFHALMCSVSEAMERLGLEGCEAAAIMNEAYGPDREDVIAVTIDAPGHVVFGKALVQKGAERVGEFEWTEDLEPIGENFLKFPRLTKTGRFVKIRILKKAG
jgi:hypothetical protein